MKGNRLVGGVRRRGFTIRRDAGSFVRFEHGAQGDEVVVQGQAAQGEDATASGWVRASSQPTRAPKEKPITCARGSSSTPRSFAVATVRSSWASRLVNRCMGGQRLTCRIDRGTESNGIVRLRTPVWFGELAVDGAWTRGL